MFKLLLCLFGLVAAISAQCFNANNGIAVTPEVGNATCACYSGFTGVSCENDDSGACAPFASVDPLNTTTVGEIVNYQISADILSFDVYSPSFNMRYFESLSFSGNESCSYPHSELFTKSFNTTACNDVYSASIEIPALVNCGFDHTQSTPMDTVEGSIQVTMVDSLGSFRGVELHRRTTSHLGLTINLPVRIDVNVSGITVFSSISATHAITEQSYDRESQIIKVIMTTSVQYPYALNQGFVSGPAFTGTVQVNEDETNECSPTNSAPCFQQTILEIPVPPGTCKENIDGAYQFSWGYACSGRVAECPASEGPGSQVVTAYITVDNPCATVEVTVDIQPDFRAYSDDAFQNPSFIFTMDRTIYFKTMFVSQVTLISAKVADLRLEVSVDGNPAVVTKDLVIQEVPTAAGMNANFVDDELFGSDATFQFDLTGGNDDISIFNTSNTDSVFTFTAKVKYALEYRTTFGRRRNVVSDTVSVSQTLVLDASASAKKASLPEQILAQESAAVKGAVVATPFLLAAAAAAYNNL